MPLLLVLNELSYKGIDARRDVLSISIHELVQLIRQIRRHRDDSVLVTETGLFNLELAAGYTMRVWAADGRNRTAMQYLKSVRQRAPFQGVGPPGVDGVAEYRYRGHSAAGLGLVHMVGGLGVSLNLSDEWRTTTIVLDRVALEEDECEQPVLIESRVEVRHASVEAHVVEHERWLCDEGLAHVHSGTSLWRVCGDVFPNLAFLPRVQGNLAGLGTEWVEPVKERLAELQTATARWDAAAKPTPEWLSHVTPESRTRRALCEFVDLDGTIRLFETHARLTPGAGRIYFRVDRAKGILVVAHIGRKL